MKNRLYKDIEKFFNSIEEDIENKKWLKTIAKAIFAIMLLFCMIICILWLITLIYSYIDYIILAIGGICCLVAFLRSMLSPRQPKQEEKKPENKEVQNDVESCEAEHKLLKANLDNVLEETSEIMKIRKKSVSAVQHYDIREGAVVHHFSVPRMGDGVDRYDMMRILQGAVNNKLEKYEWLGVSSPKFLYNGQHESSVMVDNIIIYDTDIQIDLAIATEQYFKYRDASKRNSMPLSNVDIIYDYEGL